MLFNLKIPLSNLDYLYFFWGEILKVSRRKCNLAKIQFATKCIKFNVNFILLCFIFIFRDLIILT
jgi:hypothetical protein